MPLSRDAHRKNALFCASYEHTYLLNNFDFFFILSTFYQHKTDFWKLCRKAKTKKKHRWWVKLLAVFIFILNGKFVCFIDLCFLSIPSKSRQVNFLRKYHNHLCSLHLPKPTRRHSKKQTILWRIVIEKDHSKQTSIDGAVTWRTINTWCSYCASQYICICRHVCHFPT